MTHEPKICGYMWLKTGNPESKCDGCEYENICYPDDEESKENTNEK